MKKIFCTLLIILFYISLTAQTTQKAQTDTLKKKPWNLASVAGLNANQVALSNWTQGGDNSIAWTLYGKFSADYAGEKWSLKNNLKVAYGQTKLGSADFRINDNEIYLEEVLSYNQGWKVNPFFSNSLRTVITKGFDYSKTPEMQISAFFDPAYITQSLGFEYAVEKIFLTRLGIAMQEIFTKKFNSYSDDQSTTDKVEKFKLDVGFESVSEGNIHIAENMDFTTKLRLFSRYKTLDVWDVRWDNTITAKINKYFNVNINVLVIYQKDQSIKTQLKQALQLGITYSLI